MQLYRGVNLSHLTWNCSFVAFNLALIQTMKCQKMVKHHTISRAYTGTNRQATKQALHIGTYTSNVDFTHTHTQGLSICLRHCHFIQLGANLHHFFSHFRIYKMPLFTGAQPRLTRCTGIENARTFEQRQAAAETRTRMYAGDFFS